MTAPDISASLHPPFYYCSQIRSQCPGFRHHHDLNDAKPAARCLFLHPLTTQTLFQWEAKTVKNEVNIEGISRRVHIESGC